MNNENGNSLIELVMVMMLLIFFGATIYTLIYSGSNAQQKIISEKDAQTDARIVLSALNIMLRQNDYSGGLEITENPETGENSILIKFREGDESEFYDQWIYAYDGGLYEYIGNPGDLPEAEYSFLIMEIKGKLRIDYSEEKNSVTNTLIYDYQGEEREISQTVYLRSDNSETSKTTFEGKIAIITNPISQNFEWYTAIPIMDKYGEDKVIHAEWSYQYFNDQAQLDVITELAADPDIKAFIINTSNLLPNSPALEKLVDTRKDVFVVYINPWYDIANMSKQADILLGIDELGMGPAIVRQAQKLGAKTFVHYSSVRYISQELLLSTRLELMRLECEKLGMEFVDATELDIREVGFAVSEQFILEDVAKMVSLYGKDTAFFNTGYSNRFGLIKAVIENGGIYPQSPYYPSPRQSGLTSAIDLDYNWNNWDEAHPDYKGLTEKITEALAEKDMQGRMSSWPVDIEFLFTISSAEYAVKWINGEVPKEGIDVNILKQLMKDYAGVDVYLTPYRDEAPYTKDGTGELFNNYFLTRMDYITFE